MSSPKFTPEQEKSLKEAWRLITDNFTHAVLTVSAELEDDPDGACATARFWKGGYHSAIGMCYDTMIRIQTKQEIFYGEEDDNERK